MKSSLPRQFSRLYEGPFLLPGVNVEPPAISTAVFGYRCRELGVCRGPYSGIPDVPAQVCFRQSGAEIFEIKPAIFAIDDPLPIVSCYFQAGYVSNRG